MARTEALFREKPTPTDCCTQACVALGTRVRVLESKSTFLGSF
jgi:hypothetical protein